jgi:dipeptidase E
LGFLPGSCCPHYDGEAQRRPTYHRLMRSQKVKPGIALDDCAAAHFVGTRLHRVIASKAGSHAYRVTLSGRAVKEQRLKAQRA